MLFLEICSFDFLFVIDGNIKINSNSFIGSTITSKKTSVIDRKNTEVTLSNSTWENLRKSLQKIAMSINAYVYPGSFWNLKSFWFTICNILWLKGFAYHLDTRWCSCDLLVVLEVPGTAPIAPGVVGFDLVGGGILYTCGVHPTYWCNSNLTSECGRAQKATLAGAHTEDAPLSQSCSSASSPQNERPPP